MFIVIFDSDDDPARGPRRSDELVTIDWLNAEQIDDTNLNVFLLKLIVRGQRFKNSDAARDDECSVLIAFAKNFAFPDRKFLVWTVENFRFRASQPEVAGAGFLDDQRCGLPCARSIGWIEHREIWFRAHHGEILKSHLRWTVFADGNSTVRADKLDIELADGCQADEIVCPSYET